MFSALLYRIGEGLNRAEMGQNGTTGWNCRIYRCEVRIYHTGARRLGRPGNRTRSPRDGMQPSPGMRTNKSVNLMQDHAPLLMSHVLIPILHLTVA